MEVTKPPFGKWVGFLAFWLFGYFSLGYFCLVWEGLFGLLTFLAFFVREDCNDYGLDLMFCFFG